MSLEPLTPERRRAMTRRHLLDAAAIVFARDGFHGSTLDEVAKTAGFTKGAVYSNFRSKDDLFLALLDDRIERQFAVLTEVLEGAADERPQRLPRVRDLLRSTGFLWDETWETLHLEFVLYARRNPQAAEKIAARAARERALVEEMIEQEHALAGREPRFPASELAKVSIALFAGLGSLRLLDPTTVTEITIDAALDLLYAGTAIDELPDS